MNTLYAAIKAHSELDDEQMMDAARFGADGGFSGFIYTSDGEEFCQRNKDEIWKLLHNDADSLGVNIPSLIGSFSRVDMAATPKMFECLLAWYALESVGRWLLNEAEGD